MRQSAWRVVAVAAVATLGLSACADEEPGAGEDTTGGGSGEAGEIALVSKGFQHQFWQAVKAGAEEKAEELDVKITFDGPASETEVDAQLQMLSAAIDRQPDAIGYAALDPEACVPLLDQAQSADIPVVQFDAGCDSDVPLNISKTDSMVAGALAAEHMAELIGGAGEVAIVGHSQINSTGVERRDGFVEKIEQDYPDIEIVDIQYGDGDHLKSADIAKAMITAHPDLAGLYGTNEGSAIGVVNAANELGIAPGELRFVSEPKIDGIAISLLYERGELVRVRVVVERFAQPHGHGRRRAAGDTPPAPPRPPAAPAPPSPARPRSWRSAHPGPR
jgi:ribose transport system substrate-binding protein